MLNAVLEAIFAARASHENSSPLRVRSRLAALYPPKQGACSIGSMRTAKDLARKLSAIDGQGYSNYRSIVGTYELPNDSQRPAEDTAEDHIKNSALLSIDKAQVDPYAPPSRVRLFIPADLARIPNDFVADHAGRVAVGDFLTRTFAQAAKNERDIRIAMPGQEILERTSVIADDTGVEARFTVRLPAAGRRG